MPSPTMKRAPRRKPAPEAESAAPAEEQFHCLPDSALAGSEPAAEPAAQTDLFAESAPAPAIAAEIVPAASPLPEAETPVVAEIGAPRHVPAPSVDHSERGHSRISPSKAKNLEICPRYTSDDNAEPHPITLRGTAMHEAIDSGNDEGLDDEERGLVAMCRPFLLTDEMDAEGWTARHEMRLKIADGVWGFADLVLLSPDKTRAILRDWKFSTQLQEDAETNPAAQFYALGLFKALPELTEIELTYLYPRLEQISTATFTRDQMVQFELRLATIKARVEEGAPAFAQHDNCLYCASKATCPALHALALPIARRYAETHDELTIPAEYQPSEIRDPKMMARAYEVALVLEKWVDSVKHHAKELRFETGAELDGFDFRSRAGTKKIISPEAAWAIAEAKGMTLAEFLTTIEVSARKLVDIVAGKAERGQKAKAAQDFEDTLRNEGILEVGPETTFFQRQKKTKASLPAAA